MISIFSGFPYWKYYWKVRTLIAKSIKLNFSKVCTYNASVGSMIVTLLFSLQKYLAIIPWIQVFPEPVGIFTMVNFDFCEAMMAAIVD
jgi:hypothetical protein